MLIVSILAFFVLTFLLASIVVAISWMAFLKTQAEESEAELGELAAEDEGRPLMRTERLSTITFWDNLLARFDFMDILKTRIAQADLDWSVGRVTIAMALAGAVVFLILYRFLGFAPAAAAAVLAALAPYGYILRLRNKRFRKFSENFPDVLDSLSRALRAGYPLSASMDMIAAETIPPVSTEMRKTSAEANLGVGLEPRARKSGPARAAARSESVHLRGGTAFPHRRQAERRDERPGGEHARIDRAARRDPVAGGARKTHRPDPDHPADRDRCDDDVRQPRLHGSAVQPSLRKEPDHGGGGVPDSGALRDPENRGH